jgi:ribosomal protein S18
VIVDFGFIFAVHKLVKLVKLIAVQYHWRKVREAAGFIKEQERIKSQNAEGFRRKNQRTLDRIAGNIDR